MDMRLGSYSLVVSLLITCYNYVNSRNHFSKHTMNARRKQNQSAFTIVELLIVIVVIAILAAISIVAYNGIQSRARASSASSAATQAAKKLALYQVDNGMYPANGALASAGIINGSDVNYQYSGAGTTYCLTASVSGTSYNVSNSQSPQLGACPGQVDGGAITNMVTNPSLESNLSGWGVSSWGTGGGGTVSTATNGGASGSNSFRVNFSSSPTSGQPYLVAGTSTVYPGQRYCFSVSVRPSWTGVSFDTVLQWRNSSNVWISGSGATSRSTPANAWTRLNDCGVAAVNAANVLLLVRYTAGPFPPVNSTWDNDAAMLTQDVLYNYADGNSSGWSWTGTANNSTSVGPEL